ncbi:MAG TPA: hypothetical protein VHD15_00405 [Hyphomicrobiales bacterium]|nr:hypothetical protein [Hyphomicrobiales bacterium]
MALGLFRRRERDPEERAGLARVEAWARAALGEGGGDILVRQIVCPDPGCTDIQTIVLITPPGRKSAAVSLNGEARALTEIDVRAALATLGF